MTNEEGKVKNEEINREGAQRITKDRIFPDSSFVRLCVTFFAVVVKGAGKKVKNDKL
jgi:hypothetical protein